MKSALLFAVSVLVPTAVIAQSSADHGSAAAPPAAPANGATVEDADADAAADVASPRPSIETITTVDIPASQITESAPSTPVPAATEATAQPAQ